MNLVQVGGPGSRATVNGFLGSRHYLGGLPAWKAVGVLAADDGTWLGAVVLGSPCSRVYGESFLEVRRIAVVPGSPPETSDILLRWAQGYAKGRGFSHLLAYADPNVASPMNCPGNGDGGRLWTEAGFRQDGWTRPRKSTEKGSNRRVMDGSRARYVWDVPGKHAGAGT